MVGIHLATRYRKCRFSARNRSGVSREMVSSVWIMDALSPVDSPNTHTYHHENLSILALFAITMTYLAPLTLAGPGDGRSIRREDRHSGVQRIESQNSTEEASRFPTKRKRPADAAGLQRETERAERKPRREPRSGLQRKHRVAKSATKLLILPFPCKRFGKIVHCVIDF